MGIIKKHFEEELGHLHTDLLKLAAMTEESIYKAIESLKKRDLALAKRVIDDDHIIDELELVIEERAVDLLALQQPMARDLRFIITTGIKINAELERVADLSVNIAQRVVDLGDEPLVKPLIDLPEFSDIARKMIKDVVDAFVNHDKELAKQVILSDPRADALRNKIMDELVNEYIVKDGSCAPRAIPLILIARHLERMCDHATYIAADIIYMVQAKVVKHHPEVLDENGTS